jgi:hypothetical protein
VIKLGSNDRKVGKELTCSPFLSLLTYSQSFTASFLTTQDGRWWGISHEVGKIQIPGEEVRSHKHICDGDSLGHSLLSPGPETRLCFNTFCEILPKYAKEEKGSQAVDYQLSEWLSNPLPFGTHESRWQTEVPEYMEFISLCAPTGD